MNFSRIFSPLEVKAFIRTDDVIFQGLTSIFCIKKGARPLFSIFFHHASFFFGRMEIKYKCLRIRLEDQEKRDQALILDRDEAFKADLSRRIL